MISLLLTVSAYGYQWDGGPGTQINYHLVADDFTAAEEAAVEAGFEAWNAGSGEILRGAEMHITRDTDDDSGALCNFKNEVFMADRAYFDEHGWPEGVIAVQSSCLGSYDIVFLEDETWCTGLPSDCSNSFPSIGQVAVHEMGHWVGFDHEDMHIATMNSVYPNGGDLGYTGYRINEDDYTGLRDNRPGSSTGHNLMVARFRYNGNGQSEETWTGPTYWQFSRGSDIWTGGRGTPVPIQLVYNGTATSVSPLVEWRLSTNTFCSSSDYLIGSRTPSVGSNIPYEVGPNAWSLGNTVPLGLYYLCVTVDANASIAETSEVDNHVVSERLVEVVP